MVSNLNKYTEYRKINIQLRKLIEVNFRMTVKGEPRIRVVLQIEGVPTQTAAS